MVYRHCGVTTPVWERWPSMAEVEVDGGMQEW
jgi:hypothetical protein